MPDPCCFLAVKPEIARFGADAANALEANPESTSGPGATFSATMQTESKAIGCMKQPPVKKIVS